MTLECSDDLESVKVKDVQLQVSVHQKPKSRVGDRFKRLDAGFYLNKMNSMIQFKFKFYKKNQINGRVNRKSELERHT